MCCGPDATLRWVIIVIEYAIVLSALLVVASIVLVRTWWTFSKLVRYPETVVSAIDGNLWWSSSSLEIAQHRVRSNMRTSGVPVRPFLVIGILAGRAGHLECVSPVTERHPLEGRVQRHV